MVNPYDDMMTADQVRAFRQKFGYSQEELAVIVGVSVRSVQNYEQGRLQVPEFFRNAIRMHKRLRKLTDKENKDK